LRERHFPFLEFVTLCRSRAVESQEYPLVRTCDLEELVERAILGLFRALILHNVCQIALSLIDPNFIH